MASDNGLKTQSSKVHPSPGAARSVWALPLTASCNMVGEEHDHHHTEEEQSPTDDDGNGKDMLTLMLANNGGGGQNHQQPQQPQQQQQHQLLRAADGTELLISCEDVFDVIKNG